MRRRRPSDFDSLNPAGSEAAESPRQVRAMFVLVCVAAILL